jgi:SAM-dependent methyltransferase
MDRVLEQLIKSPLPDVIRIQGRRVVIDYVLDLLDRVRGTSDPAIPPRYLNISGRGPFRLFGEHNVRLCREQAGLQPGDAVLDVGCGIGRTALALTEFLSKEGSYTGFDVIRFAIRWCGEHIASNHANFSFVHADIRNATYNPRGTIDPWAYSFPWPNGNFTFALATSVFTHMLPPGTERYLNEIARVLQPGSAFVSTWFLLDDETEAGITAGKAEYTFPHRFEKHAQLNLHSPERAVAYQRRSAVHSLTSAGFAIEKIAHGGWSGAAPEIDSGQDVIVARRSIGRP